MACVSGGGKTHNVKQIAELWIRNGGDKKWAVPMALVAWAESGGQSRCRNEIGATGLWQIYNGANTSDTLRNPDVNAKAAIAKFKAGKLAPWVSSRGAWGDWFDDNSGALTVHGWSAVADSGVKGSGNLLDGLKALNPFDKERGASLGGPGGDLIEKAANPIESLVAPVQDIADTVVAIGDFLVHPRRLLKLIIGGVLLLWGLSAVSKSVGGPHPARAVTRGTRAVASPTAKVKGTKSAMRAAVKGAVPEGGTQ